MRTRDHLANVRTTLAWVRVSLLLMAAGYAVDKLAALDARSGAGGLAAAPGRRLGLLAAGAGVVVAAAALARFLRARARIEAERFAPRPAADLALAGVVAAGALVALAVLAGTR